MGCGEWKFVQMFQVTWPCPYMVKNFKNLLRNQESDELEIWYTASGTQGLPMFSYDDPRLTLTIFMTVSNLFPNASAWVKAYTALSANVFPSFFLIPHILSTQLSDTRPTVLWFTFSNSLPDQITRYFFYYCYCHGDHDIVKPIWNQTHKTNWVSTDQIF